jgi:hypothetical protein
MASPSPSDLGANAINPSVAFYDIHGRKRETLFFYFVADTTRDGVIKFLFPFPDETCNVRISYAEMEARTNALARPITKRAMASGANRDGDYVIAVCMQPTHKYVLIIIIKFHTHTNYLAQIKYI